MHTHRAHHPVRPTPAIALCRWLASAALAMAALGALATAPNVAHAQIGMSTLTLDNLPVTLVYPTAQTGRPVALGPFTLTVAMGGAPLPGVHPLVVMSHGTGGSALSDHDLAAAFARAGFVVAQPQHEGDNHQDASAAGPASWVRRPLEVTRVIDALGRDPAWQPRLALDRVAVHGMSAGGVTAIALAGGQWRLLDLIRHCLANTEADAGFCFNDVSSAEARAARLARYESVRGVPEANLPDALKTLHGGRTPGADQPEVRPDTRIASVTLSVPVAALFTTESLARIRVPVGLVTAGGDKMLVPAFHSQRVLRHCASCTLLMDLPTAAHMDLVSPWPAAVAREVARRLPAADPAKGFDPRQRDEAFARIAAFHAKVLGR